MVIDDPTERQKELVAIRKNYKEMHAGTAAKKGVSIEFKLAETRTQMEIILWGSKKAYKKKK